jgi:hypothetical protein
MAAKIVFSKVRSPQFTKPLVYADLKELFKTPMTDEEKADLFKGFKFPHATALSVEAVIKKLREEKK